MSANELFLLSALREIRKMGYDSKFEDCHKTVLVITRMVEEVIGAVERSEVKNDVVSVMVRTAKSHAAMDFNAVRDWNSSSGCKCHYCRVARSKGIVFPMPVMKERTK